MSRGTVLITGASSGIGEAFARLFAQEDFDLVLSARRQELLETLQQELDTDVQIIPADLSHPDGVDTLINSVERPIDILINNAGTAPDNDFRNISSAEVDAVIQVNIIALTKLTHHFMQNMLTRGRGRILNVASVAAFHPVPGMDIYAATKAYVLSLSESLSENLSGTGISVTALCPGLTDTNMADPALSGVLPPFLVSSPEEVAREGYEALMNRESVKVPGPANQIAVTLAQHQPRWLVRGLGGLAARITSKS